MDAAFCLNLSVDIVPCSLKQWNPFWNPHDVFFLYDIYIDIYWYTVYRCCFSSELDRWLYLYIVAASPFFCGLTKAYKSRMCVCVCLWIRLCKCPMYPFINVTHFIPFSRLYIYIYIMNIGFRWLLLLDTTAWDKGFSYGASKKGCQKKDMVLVHRYYPIGIACTVNKSHFWANPSASSCHGKNRKDYPIELVTLERISC